MFFAAVLAAAMLLGGCTGDDKSSSDSTSQSESSETSSSSEVSSSSSGGIGGIPTITEEPYPEQPKMSDIPITPVSAFTYEYDEEKRGIVVTAYNGTDTKVHVPDTIDGYPVVCVKAGNDFQNVVSIIFPDTVQILDSGEGDRVVERKKEDDDGNYTIVTEVIRGKNNFASVEEVYIPASLVKANWSTGYEVRAIYNSVFSDNLKKVVFSENLKVIPKGMFLGLDGLETLVIPKSVTTIENQAFWNCKNLKDLTIDNAELISSNTFQGCDSLTNVRVSDNVGFVGSFAFSEQKNIRVRYKGKTYDYEHLSDFYKAVNGKTGIGESSEPSVAERSNPLTFASVKVGSDYKTLVFLDGNLVDADIDGIIYNAFYNDKSYETFALVTRGKAYCFRNGKLIFSDKISESYYGSISISQSGNAVAYINENNALILYDLDNNKKTVVNDSVDLSMGMVCISPDGKSLLYSIMPPYYARFHEENVYKYVNGKTEVVDKGAAVAISNNGEYIHFLATGEKNRQNGTLGYTIMNSKGEKLVVFNGVTSIILNSGATEAIYSGSDNNIYSNHMGGTFFFDCRSGKEIVVDCFEGEESDYHIGLRRSPTKFIRNSSFSMLTNRAAVNLYKTTDSTLRNAMLFDEALQFVRENYCFSYLDDNLYLTTVASNSEQIEYYKHIASADKVVYYDSDVNHPRTLYTFDLKTGISTKIAEGIEVEDKRYSTFRFGVLPDGSGVFYSDSVDDILYFADSKGAVKKIDENVGVKGYAGKYSTDQSNRYAYVVGENLLVYYNKTEERWYSYNAKTDKRTAIDGYDTTDDMIYLSENANSSSNPFYNVQYLPMYKTLPDGKTEVALIDSNGNVKVVGVY